MTKEEYNLYKKNIGRYMPLSKIADKIYFSRKHAAPPFMNTMIMQNLCQTSYFACVEDIDHIRLLLS